jgi:hypothetical protein
MGIRAQKSLTVKAAASYFGLPLYRVDMIGIFSPAGGRPEGAFMEACRMMEEMAPAVITVFDEIEMGIVDRTGGEQGQIFAFFLTWMGRRRGISWRRLRVASICCRRMIQQRAVDEVFLSYSLEDEQTEIFKIHLKRRCGHDRLRPNS